MSDDPHDRNYNIQNGNGGLEMNGHAQPAVLAVTPVEEMDSPKQHTKGDVTPPPPYEASPQADKYAASGSGVKEEDADKKEDSAEVKVKQVGPLEVFRFATGLDVLFIILAILSSMAHGVGIPAVIILFGEITDSFINTTPELMSAASNTSQSTPIANPFDEINEYSVWYAVLGAAVLVLAYLQVLFWNLAAERQVHKIRIKFFHSVLRQEIAWFDVHKGGELNTRLADDINKIRAGIGDKMGLMLQNLTICIAGIVIGFVRSWKLTLVILAFSLVLIVPSVGLSTMLVQKLTKKVLDAYAKAGAVADEVLSAIRTVVAFGGEDQEVKRYASNLHDAKMEGIKKESFEQLSAGFLFFAMYCVYAVAFWYGTVLYLNDELTPGNILVTFMGVLFGAFAIGQAGPNFGAFTTARGAAGAIWELIDQVPTIDCFSTEGRTLGKISKHVTFEGVHFSYPSRADVKVLKGLDLKVNIGQTVALVGSSGCGKSTVIQLVQRFYDVNNGYVKVDDIDIRDLNVSWLRDNIGVVSQEPILFATTIAENIRYGRLDVTQDEMINAAKEANAHDFISQLPEGYDTLVGERGAQLSGGQKQRIAIARALVRNPTILLLDEATSALDTESEATVQAALEKAQTGRTTIVIAHRLSTIVNSDVICAFKDGVIAEQGSHEELMRKVGGVYHTLVMKQSQKTEEEAKKPIEDDDDDEDEDLPIKESSNATPSKTQVSPEHPNRKGSAKKKPLKRMLSRQQSQMSGEMEVKDEEDEEKELEKHFSWGRIWKLNASEGCYIFFGCIGAAVNGAIQPAFAVIFSKVLGSFGQTNQGRVFSDVALYCILFAVLGVASLIASFLQGYGFSKSGQELTLRLRHMMFKAMLRQEITWFDEPKNGTGALTTRLATDVSLISGVTGIRLGVVFEVFCNIGVGIIIAFIYSWQLACLLLFGFFPLVTLAGIIEWRLYQGNGVAKQGSQEEVGKLVSESIENIRTVQSLNRGITLHEKYIDLQKKPFKQGIRGAFAGGLAFSISQGIIFFAYAAAFRLGGYLVENFNTTGVSFEDVFLCFSAILFGAFGLGKATSMVPDYAKAKAATAELFKLLDTEPSIDTYSTEGETPASYKGEVSFDNIRFRYPTRPDVRVLRGLTVAVSPGETLALVGSSGCGKSTTVQLVERFYDPISGSVKLDNHDASQLNVRWMRAQLGLVSQEPILFDRTIADNIKYGDNSRDVSLEEVMDAAKKANIHDFVNSLPLGYETNVGSKGTQLSGGQKQRIAIARALVRNPKVLLLDEATSALDTESEKVVQDALDEAKKGRTCITIAHRLSTIHNAEKIAVIRDGKVAEFGKHEELMALGGQYHALYTAQKLQH